jgi:hypothetical protein
LRSTFEQLRSRQDQQRLQRLNDLRQNWNDGARDPEQIDAEQAIADQRVLDLPGCADYMKALLWDYQNNVTQHGAWQEWLRQRQPTLLAVWGANDPIFAVARR